MFIPPRVEPGTSEGCTVGSWALLSLIGKGSFAKVYKAKNVHTGQFAAIKAIGADKITQEKIMLSLQSEISILRAVIHPNIVKLLDYHRLEHDPEGRPGQTHYLILEYCDGGDLADFLEARKRTGCRGLDEGTTQRLLRMLAMGLREMHGRSIVHRDLKPGNILLASQGAHVSVKIADFGFARALEPARLASTLCGSPLYMAPEVLSEQEYDSRSDLWSVGVMMFEMLVGHVPFSGNNIVHLKKVIDSNEAFLPFDRRDQLSPACQDLVKRLLQKNPNCRLSFAEFFSHPFLSGQPLHSLSVLPDAPEIFVHEPSSSTIEEDYVILSIPSGAASRQPQSTQPATAPTTNRRDDVQGHLLNTATSSTDADPILAAHASSLPHTLPQSLCLYVTATCICEVADWKLVNSVPAAAVHLSILAAQLQDRILALLAPSFSSSNRHHSLTSSDALQGPVSPGLLTTEDSDSEQLPPAVPERFSSPSSRSAHGLGGTPSLEQLLRCVPHEEEALCRWTFRRLHATLTRLSRLTSELLQRQPTPALPPLLPLLWQGMQSFASSAALDEMFGARATAARGYAKAATLADLLQQEPGDCMAHTPPFGHTCPQAQPELLQQRHSGTGALAEGAAAGLPCSPSFEQPPPCSDTSCTVEGLEDPCSDAGHQASEQPSREGSHRHTSAGHSDRSIGNSSRLQARFPGWGWSLDEQQLRQLRAYKFTLANRHAACVALR